VAEHDQCFTSHREWVSKASFWLTRHEKYSEFFRAFCFDSTGMICRNGGDFAKAQYPVYWIWPDQNLFNVIDSIERVKQ
jgi:hypothetical protein